MSAAQDVVGVFDSSLSQLFVAARPIKAMVKPNAKFPEHPLEDGSSIGDHRVFDLVEIELSLIIQSDDFRSVYAEIVAAFNSKTSLSVQTKAATFDDMFLTGIPHDEDPEMFDTIAVAMKLKQIPFVVAQYAALPPSQVKSKGNSSTTKTGQKNTTEATQKQESVLHGYFFGTGH